MKTIKIYEKISDEGVQCTCSEINAQLWGNFSVYILQLRKFLVFFTQETVTVSEKCLAARKNNY